MTNKEIEIKIVHLKTVSVIKEFLIKRIKKRNVFTPEKQYERNNIIQWDGCVR